MSVGSSEMQTLPSNPEPDRGRPLWLDILGITTVILVLVDLFGALLWVPREVQMGDVQRIFYFHMPSAWLALGPAFTVVFICGILYLSKKELLYDRIAVASAEIGVVFTTITLVTGPLWAKPIWGAYWTWDPRLTTTLVLWFIYVAYLMVRSSFPEGHRRARLLAVVALSAGWTCRLYSCPSGGGGPSIPRSSAHRGWIWTPPCRQCWYSLWVSSPCSMCT